MTWMCCEVFQIDMKTTVLLILIFYEEFSNTSRHFFISILCEASFVPLLSISTFTDLLSSHTLPLFLLSVWIGAFNLRLVLDGELKPFFKKNPFSFFNSTVWTLTLALLESWKGTTGLFSCWWYICFSCLHEHSYLNKSIPSFMSPSSACIWLRAAFWLGHLILILELLSCSIFSTIFVSDRWPCIWLSLMLFVKTRLDTVTASIQGLCL